MGGGGVSKIFLDAPPSTLLKWGGGSLKYFRPPTPYTLKIFHNMGCGGSLKYF